MSERLEPCYKCGRTVEIQREWHYNKTRFAIHCKCGNHLATDWIYRGEVPPINQEGLAHVWNMIQRRMKEANERKDE